MTPDQHKRGILERQVALTTYGRSFDPECYRLAERFLCGLGSPSEHIDLAQHIQDAIEGWFQTRLEAYGGQDAE